MYDDEVIEEEVDLDFEISFYEGLIRKKPDFIDALKALADAYTKKGLFEEGLKVDEYLSTLLPDDALVFYNLSCSYSLLNQADKAFRAIKRAINCGYDNFTFLKNDKDLDNLKKDSRFIKYFSQLEKKLSQPVH